jgi:hypothetical protein
VQVYIEDFMYQLIAKASSVVVLTSKLVMSSNILTHEKKQEKLVFLLRNNGNITFTFHAFDNVSLTHSRTIFQNDDKNDCNISTFPHMKNSNKCTSAMFSTLPGKIVILSMHCCQHPSMPLKTKSS